mgnify:CR=1 FL=1
MTQSSEADQLNNEFGAIYGWRVSEDGKRCVPPKQIFPPAVVERLRWIQTYVDIGGLNFAGAYNSVLAFHEVEDQREFEFGGTWMPVSDEFKEWRDHPFYGRARQMQIALALLYGFDDGGNQHE